MQQRLLQFRSACILFVLLLALVACGGSGDSGSPSPSPTATQTATQQTENEASSAVATTPTTSPESAGGPSSDDEPNDSREQATLIEPNVEYQAELSDRADVDFFVVEIPSGAAISLVMTATDTLEGTPTAVVFTPDDSYLTDGTLGLDGLRIDQRMNTTSGGAYAIQVSGGKGKYALQLLASLADDAGTGEDASDAENRPTQVRTGVELEGDLGFLDTVDYYSFRVEPGSVFSVTLSGLDVEQRLRAVVYDNNLSYIDEVDVAVTGNSGSIRRILNSTTGGTYVVGVEGAGHYGLRLDAERQNDAGSGADAPEEQREATPISLDSELSGLVGDLDDADAFTFEVEPGAQFEIELGLPGDGQVRAILFADESYVDETEVVRGGKSTTLTRLLSADDPTVYVVVVDGEGAYTLRVASGAQDDAGSGGDAGNSENDATPIETNTEYEGLLGNTDSDDYYRFEVPAGVVLAIDATAAPGSQEGIRLVLFQNGSYVDESEQIRPGESGSIRRILNDEQGGDYVLNVRGDGAYQFTVAFENQSDGGAEGDAGDSSQQAVVVAADEQLAGRLGNDDSIDTYRLENLPAGATVSIEIALADEPEDASLSLVLFNGNESYLTEAETIYAGGSTSLEHLYQEGGTLFLEFRGQGSYQFQVTIAEP